MLVIEHAVACAGPDAGLQLLGFCRRRLDAAEASIVAGRYEAGASDSQVEDLFTSDGKTSKAQARKKASRGKVVHANPTIGSKLASGDLSAEQADVLADAAEDTDGAAACDEELIESVSKVNPEQGKRKAKDWVTKRKDASDVQSEHNQQHRNRSVHRVRKRDGRHQLIIEGSETAIDRIERRVEEQGNAEYQADGGRDVPRHNHPRTRDQRRFDGTERLFRTSDGSTGTDSSGPDASAESPRSAEPEASRASVEFGASEPSPKSSGSRAATRQSTTFVAITLDQLNGVDRSVITSCDGSRLPPSVVEQLACESDLVGVIFDEIGELLWQGRRHRRATPAQIRALIARDGGCVRCHAHHDQCVAHHILPWEAPGKGKTDIDNLVFLCERCHVRLHQQNLTLVRDVETQSWKTRPATPAETPPSGGRPPKRRPGERAHGHRQSQRTVGAKPRLDELRRNLHQGEPTGNLRMSEPAEGRSAGPSNDSSGEWRE